MSISAIGSTSSAATARAAARMRGAWRSGGPRRMPARRQRRVPICRPARSCRSPIRTASPRAAAASGAFLLANGRGANVDPASALAREPFLAVAELAGTAAQSRILLAAPIALAEIEQRFADRIERREEIGFDAASAQPARPPQRAARRDRAGRAAVAGDGRRRTRRRSWRDGIVGLGLDRLPWTKSLRQWRDRVMFLRSAEGDEWPDLSDAALAAQRRRLAGAAARRQDRAGARSRPTSCRRRSARCCRGICKRRLDAEAPTHFAAPSGSSVPIDYEAEEGPKLVDPGAGAVRPRPPSERSPAAGCRWSSSCCRRRTGRCRSRATCRASGAAATRR